MTYRPFAKSSSAVAAAFLLLLGACAASPTPYQVADGKGGYTNKRLDDGGYQVTFTGNSVTPRRSVQEAVLFRAAQVTLQADGDYFKVLSNTVEPVAESPEEGGLGLASVFGGGSEGGLVSTVDFVLIGEDELPETRDPNIYNADQLIGRLRDRVLPSSTPSVAIQNGNIVNDLRAPRTRDF